MRRSVVGVGSSCHSGGHPLRQDRPQRSRLLGRRSECEELDRLLADASGGSSRVAVLRGEAGAGKSALLAYVAAQAEGWQVASAVGVESEMELAHSGLHQLCAPMLHHLDQLPAPQREALATVFGRSDGPTPDRFLVGLATLTLFAEVAERQPLVCIVDDAQWIDQASLQILGFVARRLLVERVALVCAARTGVGDHVLAEHRELSIGGLADGDARRLLLDNVPAGWTGPSATRSSRRATATPWPCSTPTSWSAADSPAGSAFQAPSRS